MKKIVIGLMGARVNNPNLGCVALTYSLLVYLKRIQDENQLSFEYLIFETHYNKEKYDELSSKLSVEVHRRNVSNCYQVSNQEHIYQII